MANGPFIPYKTVSWLTTVREDIPSGLSYEALVTAFEREMGHVESVCVVPVRFFARPSNELCRSVYFKEMSESNTIIKQYLLKSKLYKSRISLLPLFFSTDKCQ